MQYIYEKEASSTELNVTGENHKYLFKVRRVQVGDTINVRNLKDSFLYEYIVREIDKKEAILTLSEKKQDENFSRDFHLAWCIIDPKVIEKNIHQLNEIGVSKISFIYCDRSQKNFKINFERVEKILINSSMQCGRGKLMEIEIVSSIDEFISKYSDFVVIDFCENYIDSKSNIDRVLIGPEGGFSVAERELLEKFSKLGFRVKSILRSETATICVTSLILA